jgi:hypothetical protein
LEDSVRLRAGFSGVVLVLNLGCGSDDSAAAGGQTGSGGSGGSGAAAAGGSAGTLAEAGADADQTGYPPGPYGTATGDVLADLELDGYLRHESAGLAYEASFGSVQLSDVRATAPAGHALIHVSGFT